MLRNNQASQLSPPLLSRPIRIGIDVFIKKLGNPETGELVLGQ